MSKQKANALREEILRISNVDPLKCMRCGKCSATCPAYDEMNYHPHEFVYMVERGAVEELLDDTSIYRCLSCFACIDRCPRQVEPAKLIEAVRNTFLRKQGANHFKADMLPGKLDPELPQQAVVSAFRKYAK